MQAECRKILKTLKDGKSKYQKLKDSCNTGMWVAGGIALLCLRVVSLASVLVAGGAAAHVAGNFAAVGAIGAFMYGEYYKNKIAKTDEVIGQITKVED
mgnify:CR=1 FL=1